MKIKPKITHRIYTGHTSFEVDLSLEYNITFIIGDSGTGKSAVFSLIQELGTEDKRIRCINYLDCKKRYKFSIKNTNNAIFVIDNADILLDDSMRQYIATDDKNQYIIIGRNPSGLLLVPENIYELENEKKDSKTIFRLKHAL